MTKTLLSIFAAFLLSLAWPARANLEGNEWVFHHAGKDHRFKWTGHSRGTPLVHLDQLAKTFGIQVKFDPKNFLLTLENPATHSTVKMYTFNKSLEGRLVAANSITGFTIELSKPPQFEGLKLCVPIDFGDRALRPLLTGVKPSNPLVRQIERSRVVIDPGHGGNDYGTSVVSGGVSTHEKDITLALAWELKRELKARGITASLTREDDSFLTLPERTRLANSRNASLFVSLHLNADPSPKAHGHGFEIYVLSLTQADEDARLAVATENQMIPEDLSEGVDRALGELRAEANFEKSLAWAKNFVLALRDSPMPPSIKPVRAGPFYVLYGAEMPALLVESGYLTNTSDRETLVSAEKRLPLLRKLADLIAKQLTNEGKKP